MEVAFVDLGETTMSARGSVIAAGPHPHRLTYRLETTGSFITSRVVVSAEGAGWRRDLDLRRDDSGEWSIDASSDGGEDLPPAGGDTAMLRDCADCDVGYSPLTNTMPILRHAVHRQEGAEDLDAAWISVPDLQVRRLEQRYTHVRTGGASSVVRYETRSGSFTADLEIDGDGFVVIYPGLATRLD